MWNQLISRCTGLAVMYVEPVGERRILASGNTVALRRVVWCGGEVPTIYLFTIYLRLDRVSFFSLLITRLLNKKWNIIFVPNMLHKR